MSRLKALTQRGKECHKQNAHYEAPSHFCFRKKPNSVWQERDEDQPLFSNYQLLYFSLCNTNPHHKPCTASFSGFVYRDFSYFCFLNFKWHSGSAGLWEEKKKKRRTVSAKKAAQITYECSLTSEKNCTWVFNLWKKEWRSYFFFTALQLVLHCQIKCLQECKCSNSSVQNILLQQCPSWTKPFIKPTRIKRKWHPKNYMRLRHYCHVVFFALWFISHFKADFQFCLQKCQFC